MLVSRQVFYFCATRFFCAGAMFNGCNKCIACEPLMPLVLFKNTVFVAVQLLQALKVSQVPDVDGLSGRVLRSSSKLKALFGVFAICC